MHRLPGNKLVLDYKEPIFLQPSVSVRISKSQVFSHKIDPDGGKKRLIEDEIKNAR